MKIARILISACTFLFLIAGISFSENEEKFPKTGYTKNTASILAGDNENYEALCVLEKPEKVNVLGKRYSWFKIALPKKAYLYIKKDFVDLIPENKGAGTVNASNVNLRAGPGTNFSILGQVSEPEQLNIIHEIEGWYKIEPPPEIIGWVHSSQISFTQPDTEPVKAKEAIVQAPKEEEAGSKSKSGTEKTKKTAKPESKEKKNSSKSKAESVKKKDAVTP